MKFFARITAIALACFSFASTALAEQIIIAAAADLKFAMEDIAASFKRNHPQDQVDVVYGSSGNFYTQIQQGAPFDIFFSADVGYARELYSAGLAGSKPALYAVGRIVLWSPIRDATKLSLKDLTDEVFQKIAIANPKHAPYGKRAEEALRATGLWDKVQDKLVLGENIAQTAQYVETGNAQIGIIALSLAVNPQLASKGGYALIPSDLHSPLEQAYIITKQGAGKALANVFVQYMKSQDTRRIMTRYGFVLPGETMSN